MMQIMGHRGKWPRRLLRLWQQYKAMALEVTFHHPDDSSETTWEVSLPSWPWRWVCRLQGHSDSTYGECVICRKALPR
jgi:hypothetical protein